MTRFEDMAWLNEPPEWAVEGTVLRARSGDKTDFWQRTNYDFRRDDGHLLFVRRRGDFTASVIFEGAYETLYDQAGLMVRADAEHWIKFGIELTNGAHHLSVVVTHETSDWSVQRLSGTPGPVGARITRHGGAMFIEFRLGDGPWHLARLAPFPAELDDVAVGPMLCSPQRAGFEARFRDFDVGDPIAKEEIH